ncbi:MAG: AMP-binding protein, partial [Leptotrichiaceae bacterium]|nr:AMP-binding protein [Leptotrichiaceae bacterium]
MTIVNKIKELREKYPYKTALVDITTGDKLTFSHMDIKSDRICTYFEKSGFRKGDKVVIFMPVGVEFYLILLAILKMGLIAVIIDIHTEPEYMNRYCGIVSAEGIITDKMTLLKGILLKNIRKIKKKISYKKMIENSENLPVFKRKKPKKYEKEEKEIDENTPALISFTDKNIENPKIVVKTHGFFIEQYNIL